MPPQSPSAGLGGATCQQLDPAPDYATGSSSIARTGRFVAITRYQGELPMMRMLPVPVVRFLASGILAAAAPALVSAQARDARLEGVWRFSEEIDRRADGTAVKTGPDAGYDGLLIFTSSGYMSSTIMPKGRRWRRATVTPAQLRDTFEGASAHAGRYEPDTAKHTVRMESLIAIDPGDEGQWDVIGYRVRGDTLEFTGPWTYRGETLTFTVRLARVR
jgi:hypothetical protein